SSRPSLLTSFKEVLVPRARTWTCVGFDSPPKLTADPSSVAAILTLGAPLESISRRSTVSGYPVVPSGILVVGLAGNTLIIARTRPWSSTIPRHAAGARALPPESERSWSEARRRPESRDSARSGQWLLVEFHDEGIPPGFELEAVKKPQTIGNKRTFGPIGLTPSQANADFRYRFGTLSKT